VRHSNANANCNWSCAVLECAFDQSSFPWARSVAAVPRSVLVSQRDISGSITANRRTASVRISPPGRISAGCHLCKPYRRLATSKNSYPRSLASSERAPIPGKYRLLLSLVPPCCSTDTKIRQAGVVPIAANRSVQGRCSSESFPVLTCVRRRIE
jgi:hypothetical protein